MWLRVGESASVYINVCVNVCVAVPSPKDF